MYNFSNFLQFCFLYFHANIFNAKDMTEIEFAILLLDSAYTESIVGDARTHTRT